MIENTEHLLITNGQLQIEVGTRRLKEAWDRARKNGHVTDEMTRIFNEDLEGIMNKVMGLNEIAGRDRT